MHLFSQNILILIRLTKALSHVSDIAYRNCYLLNDTEYLQKYRVSHTKHEIRKSQLHYRSAFENIFASIYARTTQIDGNLEEKQK